MARYTGPSCKKCRKLDTKLFLKGGKCYSSCVMERRSAKPPMRGGSGRSFRSKQSEYAVRLAEKQRARRMIAMTEQPFRNTFARAAKTPGKTGEIFLRFLETRLDNIARRIGFATSLKTARQMVKHGHVKVNDKKVDIPSYQLKPGDRVSISSAAAETLVVRQGLEAAEKRSLRPSFITYDAAAREGKLLRWPDRGEMSFPVKELLIVEHYSK
ncbi:MAG: 30S ribosomal protein S4 [Elusimicrobiales bacterium]